ncbi:uncharacterized protein LOC124437752 [Xenia sp. Carnegie-2017]|uniref:uncharacterized protein LOC124437752 n=1 Tax=Xenia sp. Carnegie-2017 TaxID=2897299 RepID=UPI001F041D66|nr:uncharacterized protein LOC124437752 [Xenia sp. Carnegie-2017]
MFYLSHLALDDARQGKAISKTERQLSSARDDYVKLRSELNVQDSDLGDSIMQWKEEVQQFAREQQIGVSSLKSAAEDFFLLHQTVDNAQHLENFVKANDDQTRTFLGDRCFVHDAQNKVKQLEQNATRLLELKRQLLDGHVTEEQLLEQGKSQLAKITVAKLQKRLEMLYFSVTRRTKEITIADSSKRRSSMRRKCPEEKSKITSTVEELNCLSSLCALPTTSAEEIMSGDFV